ncbi:hypothetical protein NC653_009080 [Populus alba x Populus x berolinensis]|uniref:Uncharacterized protein n=1 Tax=Populus alba x Populus x berolinensis TaxID=444605 RepID=A0AAD6W9T6_9ROSI|nr:hypothetical protein NC653_009080 [Populus alba x Populus x berolinensis]
MSGLELMIGEMMEALLAALILASGIQDGHVREKHDAFFSSAKLSVRGPCP